MKIYGKKIDITLNIVRLDAKQLPCLTTETNKFLVLQHWHVLAYCAVGST